MSYDMKKQPKWVQEEVKSLDRKIESLEREVKELRTNEVTDYAGNLKWDRPVGLELTWSEVETLPQGTRVHFKQGNRREYITVHQTAHDQNLIEIYSSGGSLVIQPKASNVVTVTQERS